MQAGSEGWGFISISVYLPGLRVGSAWALLVETAKAIDGLPPDFLWVLMASVKSMRLSLMKAAHPDVGGAT
jgi:hypothetical protein